MVHFVGAGSGAVDLITVRGAKLLGEADVVIYAGSLVNPDLLSYCKEDCEIHNSAKMTLEQVIDVIKNAENAGKTTVRLHTGDSSIYGAVREEFDSLGAITCSHRLAPDLAFVLDVTHGSMEGCAPGETFPIDATVLSVGPNLHRGVTQLLRAQAEKLHMKTVDEIYPGYTCTDAWWVQVAREGIPCTLMSLPLKYMHTTVELCDLSIIGEQARLLCDTVAGLPAGWEETLCC